jgi:hypothetical protein
MVYYTMQDGVKSIIFALDLMKIQARPVRHQQFLASSYDPKDQLWPQSFCGNLSVRHV